MEMKNLLTLGSIIALVVIAALIWSLPDNGTNGSPGGTSGLSGVWVNIWDEVDVATATASTEAWLETDAGKRGFKDVIVADAVPVFSEDKELAIWIIPIKNENGSYIGFIQAETTDYESPMSYIKYSDPLDTFLNRDMAIDMHTYFILRYGTDFAPEDIREPFVVIKSEGGLFWMSEIVENGQVVDVLYSEIRLLKSTVDI